jgi:prepilin-type N-terminal cleavage/methylation domain-containing protein
MSYELRTNKAFTLIELLVAVAILVIVLSFAGIIFRVSIESHRTAIANAEIMQKLRAITDQLNADFKGFRKDGEIFLVWTASLKAGANPNDPNSYERFDRIMFFADGDFQSYGVNHPIVHGNLARVCYMLARRGGIGGIKAEDQPREKRILARTQHILTADTRFAGSRDPIGTSSEQEWYDWNNKLEYEYDSNSLEKWKNIPWQNKQNMLSVITDVKVDSPTVPDRVWGANVNPADPISIHKLLCEGVGEFKVQGWSYDAQQKRWRWVPEVDPDGNGDLTDSDFFMDSSGRVPGVLYPYPPYGMVSLGGVFKGNSFQGLLNEASFDSIPGLGRALKFTFTLYDSKGVIKNGRTFTHIVYLGD